MPKEPAALKRTRAPLATGLAALVALLAGASPAAAHHSYPATYYGTFDESGTLVTFTVWADETVKEFAFSAANTSCGSLSEGKVEGFDTVGEEHDFLIGPAAGFNARGRFDEFRTARGTLRIPIPFGGECLIPWTATTTAQLPPECHDNHDNDGDGKVDHPADPDCVSKNHSPERDTTPPDTIITSGPLNGATVGRGAVFQFAGYPSSDTASFLCQLDTAPYEPCTTGKSYFPLTEGQHTFRVKAVDAAGNQDPSPATRTFTADPTPPDTEITGGPPDGAHISDPSPAFSFAGAPASDVNRYSCYLNNAFWRCVSGATIDGAPLADGTYTFKVAAVDAHSNQDQSPAQRTFTVDTTPPNVVIASGPAEGATTNASPVFEFATDPAGDVDHFMCEKPDGTIEQCESGQPALGSPLPDGPHRLVVYAVDRAGNVDETPAERNFVVDATPPDTLITGGPAEGETVKTSSPVFSFAGDPAADTAGFECSIDSGAFEACQSGAPLSGTPLADGQHVFAVRAVDAVGNADGTAAQRTFRVDTAPPPNQGQPPGEQPASPPAFTAKAKKKQRPVKQRGLLVIATCPTESCTLLAAGMITLPGKKKKKSRLKLKSVSRPAAAGERVKLKLKLSKKSAKKLRRALRKKRTAKKTRAVIVVRAADNDGTGSPAKLRIKLKK